LQKVPGLTGILDFDLGLDLFRAVRFRSGGSESKGVAGGGAGRRRQGCAAASSPALAELGLPASVSTRDWTGR